MPSVQNYWLFHIATVSRCYLQAHHLPSSIIQFIYKNFQVLPALTIIAQLTENVLLLNPSNIASVSVQ